MSKVSKGLIWSFVERFSTQGIGFVISIIIARLVAPEIYGLIALIQVFISFAQVFIDSGFGNALIQRQNRKEIDYHTVFIFNMIISSVLYLIFFFSAPLISAFYEEPRLTLITRFVALNLIISALCIVQRTVLTINLDFKTQSKASIIAMIVSGVVGIILAYKGFEVWALVVQQLIMQLLQAVILMSLSFWRPRLQFSINSFSEMFRFGSKLLVNNLVTSLYINFANLFIGKYYSPASLAFYNRGFHLSMLFSTNIESVMQRIIYPLTCEAQSDREKLVCVYYKYLHLSNYIILPLLVLMAVLSEPLISVLLTDEWLPTAEYLTLFSINFLVYAWIDQSGSLVNAVGRSDLILKGTFIKRPMAFGLLFVSVFISVRAVCIATIVSTYFELLVNLYYAKKVTKITYFEQLKSQIDVICVNVLMGISVYLVTLIHCSMFIKLVIGVVVGVVLYLLLTYIFKLQEWGVITQFFDRLKHDDKQG